MCSPIYFFSWDDMVESVTVPNGGEKHSSTNPDHLAHMSPKIKNSLPSINLTILY